MFVDPRENDPIRAYQNELQDMSHRADQLRPLLRACDDAIARSAAKAHCLIATKRGFPIIQIGMVSDSLDEALPLLRELAKEGLHDREKKYKDDALFDVLTMRTYELGQQVVLTVMLTGKECKRVQVGTKEVPVYEIQCGDSLGSEKSPPMISTGA